MKLIVSISFALAFLASASFASSAAVDRSALLILPAEISIRASLKLTVTFRWDDDRPVILETFSRNDTLAISGELEVFDESGKEVPMSFQMSLPPMPTGRREVKKGEVVKFALHSMGGPEFPRPGRYYAIASFSGMRSDGSEVRFTTTKRWFQVTDAPSPKV